jgi:microcystin-dependent protein
MQHPSRFRVMIAAATALFAASATRRVEAQSATAVPRLPVGAIFPYAGTVENVRQVEASGFALLCDGRSVQASRFPALFAAIGSAWGGDGATAFNVPDLRGMFLRGVEFSFTSGVPNQVLADAGGRRQLHPGGHDGSTPQTTVGTFELPMVGKHRHQMQSNTTPGAATDGYAADRGLNGTSRGVVPTDDGGGNGTGDETRPVNVAVWYMVVAQ